jgi:hypothetical protein
MKLWLIDEFLPGSKRGDLFFSFVVLGIKPRVSCMLSKHKTTELHPQPKRGDLRGRQRLRRWKIPRGKLKNRLATLASVPK